MKSSSLVPIFFCLLAFGVGMALFAPPVEAEPQEPVAWGDPLEFHTFSIAAVDPETGEVGVAVTTRNACVGNGVPWVRVGVGAVATQARTRTEYGAELLDMLEEGTAADAALAKAVASDPDSAHRQVGVISARGGSAQHTGDETTAWAGHRSGPHFVTQGNTLVGPEVVEAVARSFTSTEGSGRRLADRLIEALASGQAAGGDARKGRLQSAAVIVADPTPGVARRADGITVHINVCENSRPVAELRRIHDTISETLGFRTLQQYAGRDVWQLKVILHALGYFQPDQEKLERGEGRDAFIYSAGLVDAVEAFRGAEGLSTSESGSPPGLVDAEMIARLWEALEKGGKAQEIREQLKEITVIHR